ncbi:hypothetical protein Ddye_000427 [Dipteronia dyeriana]|uniref:DUF1985 domain-containing protein n=1 Tax=Dipteronia dyeriana TaxID=168575 RepID=A0AAD9XMY0_9ROSI|nr:hypothetical protein Ddye_000427 [Dipteronia dyeriana]
MTSRLKESLQTPEVDWFKGKLTRHDHFEALARIDNALNRVPEEFDVEDRCRFMAFCFRHFMLMHRELKFSCGVIHQLLLRDLDHDGPTDEIRFLLGNHVVRFSKVEFSLITRFRFGVVPGTSMYVAVENGVHQRYFPGHDEVSLDDLRVVLTRREFQRAYDAVKLCLIYMLNWILIGVDERLKIPVWQFRLVEDINAFDAFPWGAHIFAFEVIPQLGVNFGTRSTYLSPRMLKWELTKQPRGKKLDKIFSARMSTRMKIVPTAAEAMAPYFAGLSEGGSPYVQDDRVHLPTVPDPTTSAVHPEEEGGGPTTSAGLDFSGMDTGGSEPSPRRVRCRKVLFTTSRTGTDTGDSRAGVRLDEEVS